MLVTGRPPRGDLRWAVVVAGLVAGGVWSAAPTGVRAVDAVWCAGLVGGLAAVGASASAFVLLPVAAAAALLGRSGPAVALAVAAVLVSVGATVRPRPSGPLPALAAGLVGLSLLQGSGPSSRPLATLTSTVLVAVILAAGIRSMGSRRRRWWAVGALGVVGFVAACALVGGLAVLLVRGDARRGIDDLRAARAAGTAGDLHGAVADARAAEAAFRSARGPLGTAGAVGRLVPVVAQQLAATRSALATAGDAAAALRRAGDHIDLDAIAVTGGRVDLGELGATGPALDQLSTSTAEAARRLASIDRSLLLGPVSHALDQASTEAQHVATTADRLHRAVEVLPALLGRDAPTRWLVLFTSPDEARNRFGFPGAYAILRVDDGHVSFDGGGPDSSLDRPGSVVDQSVLTIPPRAVPYEPYGITQQWRQLTMSPDGPTVTDLALQLAAQSHLGPLDGVVLADPAALAGVVRLLGSVPVPGLDVTLTADTTIDFLVRRQYLEFPGLGQQADRKDLLSDVADQVGQRLSSLTVPSLRDLADTFGPLVQEGHLVVAVPSTTRPEAAQLLADLRLDGAFPRPGDAGTDVLFAGQRNVAGNKIDLFLERTVRYDATISRRGAIRAALTLDLTNTAPAAGLPPYLIGAGLVPPPPPGTNLTSTLIYSRQRLTSLTVDGRAITPPVLVDGGLLVYQVDLRLGPGQHVRVVAQLTGPAPPAPYALDLYPSGLVHPDTVSIDVRDDRDGRRLRSAGVSAAPSCQSAVPAACAGRA